MESPRIPVVDIVTNGDTLVAVRGVAGQPGPVALRVSSHVLTMTSAVFAKLLQSAHKDDQGVLQLSLAETSGYSMCTLMYILHLRNDKLPPRVPLPLLRVLASLAGKYKCVVATGRATLQWFYAFKSSPPDSLEDLFTLLEAARLLDEPTFFAHFTEYCVLYHRLDTKILSTAQEPSIQRFAVKLTAKRAACLDEVRDEVDEMMDICTKGFQSSAGHHINYAPGMDPDSDDESGLCWVDRHAGGEYLAALKKAHIWPKKNWPVTLGGIVEAIKDFEVPEYDDTDKCEFCEGVKCKFGLAVDVVKALQKKRLWGLCLDCFNAGGVHKGECRVAHAKPAAGS